MGRETGEQRGGGVELKSRGGGGMMGRDALEEQSSKVRGINLVF